MTSAVRGAIAAGAQYLLSNIHETNGWTFAFDPPTVPHGSEVVRTVTNYYSRKTVTVPVPKYEDRTVYYEEYETLVPDPSGSPGAPPRRIKKRRRIGSPAEASNPRYVVKATEHVVVGQSGKTMQKDILVPDPNGSVSSVNTVRKPGIAYFWPTGFLGQQAMALLVLRKCGLSEDDDGVRSLADMLNAVVLGYGAPDTTWDLAWVAAALAHMEAERYHEARDAAIGKLLDGQITKGAARGLWGPVCVNTDMLGAVLKRHQAILQKAGRNVGEKMDPAVEAELTELSRIARTVAQQGLRAADITTWYVLGLNDHNPAGLDVIAEGLPFSLYAETCADMESTALAVYALAEARGRKVLPEATPRPDGDPRRRTSSSWPRPERTDVILARCAAAVTALQTQDGRLPEANVYQKTEMEAAPGFTGGMELPVPKAGAEPTAVSSARGVAALFRVGDAVGWDKLLGRYRANVAAAFTLRRELVRQYGEGTLALTPPRFCHFLPEEFAFNLSGVQRAVGADEERDRGMWQQLALALIERQDTAGDWSLPFATYAVKSTSVWRQLPDRERVRLETLKANSPPGRRQAEPFPTDPDAFYAEWLQRAARPLQHPMAGAWRLSERPVLLRAGVAPTVYALLFLLDGFRPPALGYVADALQSTPSALQAAVTSNLAKRDAVNPIALRVEAGSTARIQGAPVLFASSPVFLDRAGIVGSLKQALAAGGTLVVEGAFAFEGLAARLAALVEGGRPGTVPDAAPWLREWTGTRPKLQAVLRADGSTAVLLLPWASGAAQPGRLSAAEAVQAAYYLVRSRVSEWERNDVFDVNPRTVPDPIGMRDNALSRLTAKTAAAPAPVAATAAGAGGVEVRPSEPEEPPPPKPDEVW